MSASLRLSRTGAIALVCLALAACSEGTSTSSTPPTLPTLGTAPVLFTGFVTQGEVDAAGNMLGLPAGSGTVIRSGTDGYAYFATNVDSGNVPQTGLTPGQSVFISTSGVLPTTSLGAPPTSGAATMSGLYRLRHVSIPANRTLPNASDIEEANGSIMLSVDFGSSTVNALTAPLAGQQLTIQDFGSFGDRLFMSATYRGVPGVVNGQIGANRAVGAMAGSSLTGQFSGGFIVDR